MRILVASLAFIAIVVMLPPAARAELVDHIVAAVNNEVITASELAQTMALNERLGTSGGDDRTRESETLEGLITRRLLVQEARRLRFVEVSDQEKSSEVDKIRARFASDAAFSDFLRALDMKEPELAVMLGERLLVEKFVEKKVGLFVRVTRAEAETYFQEHAAAYPGQRFQDVQKSIMTLLTERKVRQQLDQYIAELRGKAAIRVNRLNDTDNGAAEIVSKGLCKTERVFTAEDAEKFKFQNKSKQKRPGNNPAGSSLENLARM